MDAPQMILSDGLANASDVAAVNLPCFDHVQCEIWRQRGGNDTPAIPQNRAGIPMIQNEFQQTMEIDFCCMIVVLEIPIGFLYFPPMKD